MILNYIKIALRNLLRYRTYSFINILGLTIGFTVFVAIALYVFDEFSYDRFHEKQHRIYRAVITAEFDGQVNKWSRVPNLVAPTAKQEIPEIEKSARYFHHNFGDLAFLSINDEKFTETQLYYADPEFFDIFTVDFVKGNKAKALSKPGTIVISESAATKYFSGVDPIGQIITINNNLSMEVTGVYRDFPPNSSLQASLIASFASNWFGEDRNQSWGNASFESFFLLHDESDKETVDAKIENMLNKHIEKENRWFKISLQPLTDIHLKSGDLNATFDRTTYGDMNQVRILMALALIVLVIAAINYMNMATAQSQRRNKEVGISKTLGATSRHLSGKFYFETSVFVVLAMVLSLIIFTAILPLYNDVAGKQVTMDFLRATWFWCGFAAIGILLTVLAGSYPAWYLSSFSPKTALHKTTSGGSQAVVRKGLVVIQFSASMVLIVSTLVFHRQMSYIRNKKLGYEPEQVIAVMTSGTRDQDLIRSLKTEYEKLPEVKGVCRSQSYPGIGTSAYTIKRERDTPEGASILTTRATSEIVDVLGIKLLAGKTLPAIKDPSDTTLQVVLNKSAVDYLHLSPEEAVGQQVYIFGNKPAEVVGVTENFHFTSLHQQIGPYAFNNIPDNRYNYLLVKVETSDVLKTVEKLEALYKQLIPAAFDYTFIDDRMASLYHTEQKLANVVMMGSVIAIFIACLGLYALAAFTANQRTKEIGIRKVMGASVSQLVAMLSKDFLKLVVIAIGIGLPAGYYLMNNWLERFAYKTTIGLTVFAAAALISLLIAWITVSFESIKAATTNPVNSLRNE
ncbi:MAG: ABC transporter permease [Flammeovirgaceae bacterium]|nr:MAG: ABC transporter permease [Flammeovirgaceae bacterium]